MWGLNCALSLWNSSERTTQQIILPIVAMFGMAPPTQHFWPITQEFLDTDWEKKFSLADVSRSSCKNSWDQRRQLSILKYVTAFVSCMDAFMELKQLTVCNSWHYSKSNHILLPAALWVQQWKYFTLYSSRTERQLQRSTTKAGGTEQLQSACCVRTLC